MITTGIKALMQKANSEIETIPAHVAITLLGTDGVEFIDIRDVRELKRDGAVPGAFHAPRGMLEFWVDPDSPYHKEIFASGKKFIFLCAAGSRSSLATKAVQDMGLKPVAHVEGGYSAWCSAGGPIQQIER